MMDGQTNGFNARVQRYARPRSVVGPLIALGSGMVAGAFSYFYYMKWKREQFWKEHPGERMPTERPPTYFGPWKASAEFWLNAGRSEPAK